MIKTRIRGFLRAVPCTLFFLIVLFHSASNLFSVKSMVLGDGFSELSEFLNGFETGLSENFRQKNAYINLHGLYAKIMGFNELNEVQRLKNGYLVGGTQDFASEALADNLRKLNDYADAHDMGFLCVPVPRKKEFYAVEPSPGHESKYGEISAFLDMLRERQVNVLDMNRWYEENGWTMEDTYLATDHHWRPEAAFEAFRQIMAFYGKTYDVIYDPESLDLSNWNVEVYEDWMLGSRGLRTGIYYGGLDDLTYIYPGFETDIHISRISTDKQLYTHMEETVYDMEYLQNPNTFDSWPYCIYMGGDYPYTFISNPLAVNDKKLLVVGDSYRLPVECFLTTQFSELYHIDMRFYQDGSFMEFLNQIQPDLILDCFCGCADDPKHDYGMEAWARDFAKKTPTLLRTEEKIQLDLTESIRDRYLLEANLAAGAYEVTLDSAMLEQLIPTEEGSGSFIQMSVVDLNTNWIGATRYFLAGYGQPQKWLFTVPENPEANYAIFLYNGTNGYTGGNVTTVENVNLSQFE